MDQRRVRPCQRARVEPQWFEFAGLVIEHDDVCGGDEIARRSELARRVQIERDNALAAVEREVSRIVLQGVSAGRLDLDRLGAVIGQQRTGKRTCHALGKIEYANARICTRHALPPQRGYALSPRGVHQPMRSTDAAPARRLDARR